MATNNADEFTSRMFEAINGMLLDVLAAVARKDYDDRRRRQAQGIAKMKAEGKTAVAARSQADGPRMLSATPGLPNNSATACPGRRFRRPRTVHAPPSSQFTSGWLRQVSHD